MKVRILFFLFAFAFSLTTNAQITKGNWLVGGDGNFGYSKVKDKNNDGRETTDDAFGFRIQPKIGYFLVDKFAAGLSLALNHNNPSGGDSTWNYGVGPFLSYYFLPTDNLINVFSEADYSFASDLNESSPTHTNIVRLKAGAVIFFTGSVGLEMTLNYDYSKSNNSYGSFISKRFSLGIGFQVHLKKK